MQHRLEEVMDKNSGDEVKMKVEHFQNQILIQEQAISKLNHHIKAEEKLIQNNIANNPIASDHRKIDDHVESRNMIVVFETNINSIRKDLNLFLRQWM